MKSINDLTDFYYNTLHDDLQALDEERAAIARKLKLSFAALAIITIPLMMLLYKESGGFHDGMIFIVVIAVIIGSIFKRVMTRDYTGDFKRKVIQPLIHAIEKDLVYRPQGILPERIFKGANIFRHRIDRYRGNDYVTGSIDGVALHFSDVHAEYESKDSKGRTSWNTIFNGLFIVAEFNKNFKGKTIILPDRAERMFGSLIGKWLQSKNILREALVKMDDPTFEKHFVVYGSDQIEARYLLTHSMMQRLVAFKQRSKEDVFISFVGSNIHIAISGGDRFEPTIFKSLLDYKQAMAYVATLKLAIGIVDDLKLNERLWSKL